MRYRHGSNNLSNIIGVFGSVLQQLVGLLIIFLGARLVIAGEISIGALVAANILASHALAPMRQVVSAWSQLQEVRAAFGRLNEIMETQPEEEPGEFASLPSVKGDIGFEDVNFSYDRDVSPTLKGINFGISQGETVCIMGPTGSGKSTLASYCRVSTSLILGAS